MYSNNYRKLNSTETIISSIPKLIEAFVTFYGESERQNITDKFANIFVIGYGKPDAIMSIIRKDNEKKSDELIEKLLNKLNIPNEKRKEIKEIYFANNNLNYPFSHPICRYIHYINGRNNYKNLTIEFLSKLYPGVTMDNIDEFIKTQDLTELNDFIKVYNEIIKEYEEYLKQFETYNEYNKKCEKYRSELEKKYTKEFFDEFKYLFNEEEIKEVEEKRNNSIGISIKSINKKTECYFGYSFYGSALVDAFSEENEKLIDGNSWRKEYVIKDRIKFFKKLNVDLGDDYETYLNNPDIQKLLIPLKELAEKMKTKRKELYTKMMNEYYQSLEEYQRNIKRIEEAGLLDKEHSYNANAYENHSTFVSTNIKKTETGYKLYPMLCFSIGHLSEYLDVALIHELNHIYELNLQTVDEFKYSVMCGWEPLEGTLGNSAEETVSLEKNTKKRNYELFNEIINELIAQEITEILFSTDGYIFNTKEDAKIKSGTSYENTMFIVKEFYNTYKKEIIESRKTGDMSKLFDIVGKENFEKMNELFHIFYKEFPEITFYQALNSMSKKEETEKTKKLQEIINTRNEILIAMNEHSKKNNHTL